MGGGLQELRSGCPLGSLMRFSGLECPIDSALPGLHRRCDGCELELKLGERFVAGSVERGRIVFDPHGHAVGQELHESQVSATAIGSLLVVAEHLMYLRAGIRLVSP